MLKIQDVLRLRHESGLSVRAIARSCQLSKSAVANYLCLAKAMGLGWPLPAGMDEAALEKLLKPSPSNIFTRFAPPDFPALHLELKRKGVTLALLWEEYRQIHPTDGYSYSQFCDLYRRWNGCQQRSMRQVHKAGEKMFVDYAGPTVPVVANRMTGEVRQAQIFVAVLGASNYTYAEATWTQTLPDWISSQVRAFEFFGGVPELVVPDNLKSGVSKACRYEPEINPSYADMSRHYGVAILPARPYHPKDKAKVEVAVQVVERWILARLRHLTFFSLADLNKAIFKLLEELNNRPFKKMEGSRKSHFESLDKPALKPLPASRYEYSRWIKARVAIDYHLEIEKHYYSVPHNLVGQEVDVRLTASVVEVLHKGHRVASHPRSFNKYQRSTTHDHMPKAHQKHLEWTPGRFLNWANQIGSNTRDLVRHLLENRPHPEHGYRSCLGLLSLARRYSPSRLEAACARAVALNALTYRSAKSILEQGLDRQPLPQTLPFEDLFKLPSHANVRGPQYYN